METTNCPRCGTPLDLQQDSQCPVCLLRPTWKLPQPIVITLGPGQTFTPPPVEDVTDRLPGYEVEALIGRGGMGAVYRGYQKSLQRPVAIKILPPQIAERPGFRERFAREARALARLNHPHIVGVYDFGEAAPYAYLVMELVEGANLREVMAQGRLSPTEALEIVPQLCDALSYAHGEGVVHRDIKPENLLFDARGRLKITDFGLAKIVAAKGNGRAPASVLDKSDPSDRSDMSNQSDMLDDRDEGTREVIGTVHYMAPEQLENPRSVDHRADIYALGVVFYEMLTGELPIGRFDPPSRVEPRGEQSPERIRLAIDVRLDEIVLRALEKQPERRYGSAAEIRDQIDSLGSGPRSNASHGSSPSPGRTAHDRYAERYAETAESLKAAAVVAAEQAGRVGRRVAEVASDRYHVARERLVDEPKIQIPAFMSLGLLLLGFGLCWYGFADHAEEFGFTSLLVLGVASLILARVANRHASAAGPEAVASSSAIIARGVLATIYLMIAAVVVLVPLFAAGAAWFGFFGEPRNPPDEPGWLRDVGNIAGWLTAATGGWLLAITLFHWAVPRVLSFVFKPFVGPMRFTRALALTLVLALITAGGVGLLYGSSYRVIDPATDPDNPAGWGELSPNEARRLRAERERQERVREVEAAAAAARRGE